MRAVGLGLAAAIGAAGCSNWPDLSPTDGHEALDPRLGTEIDESTNQFRIGTVFQDDGLIVVYEDTGAGYHTVRVDPETSDVTQLPAPPLEPGEVWNLGRAIAPMRAVISVARGAELVEMVLDDDGWTTLPDPPVDATLAGETGQLLAHDGNVYQTIGTTVLVWNGSDWTQPISTAAPIALGGFDAQTQWVIESDGAVPIDADGAAGTKVPHALGSATPSAVNGTADGFQIDFGGTLYTFDGATFTPHDAVPGSPYSAPGYTRVLLAANGAPSDAWSYAEDGVVGATALSPFSAHISCACDLATDESCTCRDHSVDYVDMKPSPDTDEIAMTMGDAVNGNAVLTVRFLSLPFTGDPFSPM